MSQYHLICPRWDGSQHRACLTDEQAAMFPWGRRLPRQAEVEAYVLRDRSGDFATPNDMRIGWYRRNYDPFTPEYCHFDFVGPDTLTEAHWPRHARYTAQIGPWGWGTEMYRDIRDNYVCSIHREHPKPMIRDHTVRNRLDAIKRQHFTNVSRRATPDELRQMLGRHHDGVQALGLPYGFHFLRYWYPNRVTETTHDVW